MGVAGSGSKPVVTYVTSQGTSGNLTTYTFSSVSLGTPKANRLVVVLVQAGNGSTSTLRPLSSGTIAGVATTVHTGVSDNGGGGGNHVNIDMMSAVVPTGSTGQITVTFTGANTNCQIHVYNILRYADATPTVYTDVDATGAPVVAVTASHPNGVAIGGAICRTTTRTYTVTTDGPFPVTEDADTSPESGTGTVAVHLDDAGGSPNITFTPSGSTVDQVAMVAVWE